MFDKAAGHQSSTAATDAQIIEEKEMTNTRAPAKTARHLRRVALAIAALVIGATASAQMMHINFAPSAYDPYVEFGLSGGQRDAAREIGYDWFGNLCTGYIFHSPDHVIRLSHSQPSLTVEVESFEDTTLVIFHRETGMVFCDDDSGYGHDAEVSLFNWPAGTYEVFVGSYWYGDYWDYALYVYE